MSAACIMGPSQLLLPFLLMQQGPVYYQLFTLLLLPAFVRSVRGRMFVLLTPPSLCVVHNSAPLAALRMAAASLAFR